MSVEYVQPSDWEDAGIKHYWSSTCGPFVEAWKDIRQLDVHWWDSQGYGRILSRQEPEVFALVASQEYFA